MLADDVAFVLGVDTHADSHVLASSTRARSAPGAR